MIVYHGGIDCIELPNITFGRKNVDFGQGFYITNIYSQALRWAKRKATFEKMKGNDSIPIVNKYSLNLSSGLNILEFEEYNRSWLKYVVWNRTGKYFDIKDDYDIVIGPVADDDIINQVDQFIYLLENNKVDNNVYTFYLELFSFAKKSNQICIKTEQGLSSLKYIESENV